MRHPRPRTQSTGSVGEQPPKVPNTRKQLFEEIYAKHNIKGIFCGVIPPEASGWFRKEINTIEDMKGMKMRFFGLGAKVMEKIGVSTQLIAGGDIFPALELGTIDATEFSMPAVDLNLGFYQVAKHYYFKRNCTFPGALL